MTFEAELRHSYAGFDLGERTSTQVLTAVRSTKGWRLSEQLACTGEPALWSDPTFLLRMSADVLLLSTEGVEETEQRFADAARAVRLAREAWPGASAPAADRGLVLLSPATAEQHALVTQQGEVTELTGSSAASAPTTPQVAAITDGPDGPGGRSTADRVVVNPLALGRLTPPGRAFVLAHEAVHVRLRAMTGGRLPAWLSEGFADWVAYRHTGLDAAVIAAPALPDVRSGTLPTSFPAPSDFDSSTTALAPAYARSWVLVSLLVERHGESAVRDLIATIAATTSDAAISGDAISGAAGSAIDAATDAAFSSVLGTTRSEVLAQWLARLRLLAAAGQP